MEELNGYEKLMRQAKQDQYYQACLTEVKRMEPFYLALKDAFSQEQKNILEDYLFACEELDPALVMLALQNK